MSYIPTRTDAARILLDPASTWRWVVALPSDVTINVPSNYSFDQNFASTNSSRYLSVPTVPFGRVETVGLPGISIDTDARFGAAIRAHYPRFLEVSDMSITFYEDSNYTSLMYLTSWRNLVVDENHNYGTPTNISDPSKGFKKTVFFFAFNTINHTSPTLTGEIQGCFPKDPGNGLQYEYGTSGMVTLSCNFSVDYVKLHWNPQQLR